MAKWGFLKNIVNIDRFFASGAGSDDKKDDKKEEKKGKDKEKEQKKDRAVRIADVPNIVPPIIEFIKA